MRLAVLLVLVAACGDNLAARLGRDGGAGSDAALVDGALVDAATDGSFDAPPVDSGGPSDSSGPSDSMVIVATVTTVACTSGEPTITTSGFSFSPSTLTISANEVVKFVMPASHDVAPDTGSDPGLVVGFSETKCLKFTAAGTFGFHCVPHGFTGSITVQ